MTINCNDCTPFPPNQFGSLTLTGTSGGGPVSPNANGNFIFADPGIQIIGNPATNTLNFFGPTFLSIPWIDVTTSPITLSPNTGYIDHFNGDTQYTLPTTAALGTVLFIISGQNAGSGQLWTIHQNAGQQITVGGDASTVGVTGSVTAQSVGASLYLVNTVANLSWVAISIFGNINVM